MMNEETNGIGEKLVRDEKGRFVEGHPDLGAGAPEGPQIKTRIKKLFKENPEKLKDFIDGLIEKYPGLVWQMLEGKPPQDLNLGQNPELPFTIIIKRDGDERKDS